MRIVNELPSHPVIPMADFGWWRGMAGHNLFGGVEPLSLDPKENSAQGDWVTIITHCFCLRPPETTYIHVPTTKVLMQSPIVFTMMTIQYPHAKRRAFSSLRLIPGRKKNKKKKKKTGKPAEEVHIHAPSSPRSTINRPRGHSTLMDKSIC